MTVHVHSSALRTTVKTTSKVAAAGKLARHRREYDRRRRQPFLEPSVRDEFRAYADIVRRDPCSYCMGHCGQMAADHIVPLDAGGENRASNLTAAGRPCNAAKKAQPLLLFLATRKAP